MSWDVLVPVKPLDVAKSRLAGLPRAPLTRAFALDVVRAAVACPEVRRVLVVSDDADLGTAVAGVGAERVPDRGGGLNAALVAAAADLVDPVGVLALLGDLPCLRSADLTEVLHQAARPGVVVADADGLGTTMLAVADVADLHPRFGAGSLQAHTSAGYLALAAPATARRDVDTAADLAAAVQLGVGPHTAEVLQAHEGR